ncbi:hypothetical protein [Chitinophaga nivalis]|uniref:Hemocyanin middle domain-containing protein n=1 Tax=Chitinophaga nivalis TaxID=2991709 RepID=A0ABT3IKE3_9BACT|nr:hypothetical protein [Chitinophaga nivalis]MCW3465916.1 hypothetical protein [Chitinophaga nivalis]MCW3484393.1 hypothetical protein [Chitinophaga nivalis]
MEKKSAGIMIRLSHEEMYGIKGGISIGVTLHEDPGNNILGNIITSNALSVNRDFYGDLHNFGHVAISYIHEPDGSLEQSIDIKLGQ